jgi:hypothetical protein
MREVAERKTQKLAQAQAELEVRHEKAEALHEAYVNQIKSKAENESNKVKELQWISSMTYGWSEFYFFELKAEIRLLSTDFKKSEMKQKMDGAEARRLEIEEERKRKQVELVDPKKSVRFKKICKYCQTEVRDLIPTRRVIQLIIIPLTIIDKGIRGLHSTFLGPTAHKSSKSGRY